MACGNDCLANLHRKYDFQVEYKDSNGQICTLSLEAKLYSDYFSKGFKSVVNKRQNPNCI